MELRLHHITKSYPGLELFTDFSLSFREKSITCILGPSGCGKTTLLNIIARNTSIDLGEVSGYNGKEVSYIFQEPRILPWKTVEDNVRFVLKDIMTPALQQETTAKILSLVGLEGKETLYPSQLSGGMKQRVSIARAFAYPSHLILMDEPFKALDYQLKKNLMDAFINLWTEDQRTVIAVTHEVDEALYLGQEVIVLSHPPAKITGRFTIDAAVKDRNLDDSPFLQRKREIIQKLTD